MNAVVYARFSSHRQGEQSIEGQVAEAERFAAAHGLTIVKVYADRAQTGRNDNREQFQLMLADAAKHAFDALIVWKTDRIGRNKEEIALNKYHLKKNGVKIYYVAEAIPDTPEGIILEAVIEGMAAYYSEQLSQNVRRGMRMCAQKAQSTGGTHPLGYTVDENKKFVIDPKHAPTVQEIYQLYSEGKTISEIVKHLNDKGLRTARGRPFTHNSLRTVLKNKKYIGTFEYNGEVSIENAVPPIVDVETFNKVQELLAFNQKAGAHKKAKVEYLLFSKIFCGKCGDMMVGICGTSKAGVTHHYYACRAQRKHQCNKRAVRQDWIEGIVLRHLTRLVKNTDLLEFIAENTYQYYLAQNTDTTYTKSLQKALDETERAINNLLRAIEAGIFNESTKDRMDELQEQKSDLKSALAAAKLKEDLGLKKEHILFFLHQFTNMDYSDIDCQRRLIKTFLNSVFVYDDKVVLTFNYSGDDRTITLHEIDGGLGHSICIPSCVVHHEKNPDAYASGFFHVNHYPYSNRKAVEKTVRWTFHLTHTLMLPQLPQSLRHQGAQHPLPLCHPIKHGPKFRTCRPGSIFPHQPPGPMVTPFQNFPRRSSTAGQQVSLWRGSVAKELDPSQTGKILPLPLLQPAQQFPAPAGCLAPHFFVRSHLLLDLLHQRAQVLPHLLRPRLTQHPLPYPLLHCPIQLFHNTTPSFQHTQEGLFFAKNFLPGAFLFRSNVLLL